MNLVRLKIVTATAARNTIRIIYKLPGILVSRVLVPMETATLPEISSRDVGLGWGPLFSSKSGDKYPPSRDTASSTLGTLVYRVSLFFIISRCAGLEFLLIEERDKIYYF